ncbi:hypothetical protein [Polyangium sp. 15x6]|uniref:hypothetical protein n=1 Tax=Polyangium sp. 15x6 TaxID=3042687 RepID=UPI00249BAA94|nr:hypothetical protein [Polyangium sp. 15x6]MDI3290655.1 hypothetical protein [Polyangium sp. 15x6]
MAQQPTKATPSAPASPGEQPVRFFSLARDISGPHRIDARHVVWGGLRAEVDGGTVTRVAEQALSGSIIAAVPSGSDWIFVDQRGNASRATGFLGTPVPLGRVAPSFEVTCRGASGRVACVADGALWITDGVAPIAPAPEHHRGPVLSAAFLDARFGAAVFEGGVLAITRDGGASWRTQPMPDGRASIEVFVREGELEVRTTRGWYGLHVDQPPTRGAPNIDRSDWRNRAAAELAPSLLAVFAEHFPFQWEELGFTRPFQRRNDGTFLWLDDRANTTTRYDRKRGTELTGAANRAQFRRDTDLDAWGEGLVLRRGGELFRATKGLAFERVATDADDSRACVVVASDDGLHAAGIGPCNGEPTLTVLDEEHARMRPLALAPEDTPQSFVGMHGTHVLGVRCTVRSGAKPPCAPVVIDTARGTRVALTLDGEPLPATLEGTLARDGTVTALLMPPEGTLARDGMATALLAPSDAASSQLSVAVGPITGPLHKVALPAGALTARFFDARRGIAVGETWGSLQRTLDGGAHWEPLRIPSSIVAPDARIFGGVYLSHSWTGTLAGSMDCDEHRCSLFAQVAMVGWGKLPEALSDEAPRGQPALPPRRDWRVDCTYRLPANTRESGAAPANVGEEGLPRDIRESNAWVHIERAGAQSVSLRWQIERNGAPSPLRGSATFRLDGVPSPDAEATSAQRVRWDLRAVTDRGVLLERCVSSTECTLIFSGARGAPVVLRPPASDDDYTPRAKVFDALALANGDLVVRAQSAVERVIVFAPDGRARWQRDFTFDREHSGQAYWDHRVRGLALRAGAPGYAAETDARGSLLFFPLTEASADPEHIAAPASAHFRACTSAVTPAGAVSVRLAQYSSPSVSLSYTVEDGGGSRGLTGSATRVYAVVERTDEGVCLRSIERTEGSALASRDYHGISVRASSDGALRGRYAGPPGTYPLRCKVE